MLKLINNLINSGKKRTSENSLLRVSKNLQKCSGKNFNNIIKLAIIFSTSIFKINLTEKTNQNKIYKKGFFNLQQKNKSRISLSIKYLITIMKNQKVDSFNKKFYNGIFLFFKHKNNIEKKNNLQEQIFLNKHIFFYYRWR